MNQYLLHRTSTCEATGTALHIVLLLVILVLLMQNVQAQETPQILSSRIGSEIGSEARTYFLLFPDVSDFVSARLWSDAASASYFRVKRNMDGMMVDAVIAVSGNVLAAIRHHINRYEQIYLAEDTTNWTLLHGFAGRGQTFVPTGTVTVEDVENNSFTGMVLVATDSVIVLWPKGQPYRWETVEQFAMPIPARRISRISSGKLGYSLGLGIGAATGAVVVDIMVNSGKSAQVSTAGSAFVLSAALGGIIGGMFDLTIDVRGDVNEFRRHIPTLQNHAFFYSVPPPEVRRLVNNITTMPTANNHSHIPAQNNLVEDIGWPKKWHLGIAYHGIFQQNTTTYSIRTVGNRKDHQPYSPNHGFNAELRYSLTPTVQVGLLALHAPELDQDSDNVEYINAYSGVVFANYAMAPVGTTTLRGFDYSLGLGLSYTSATIRGRLTAPDLNSTIPPVSYQTTGGVLGIVLRASLEYYIVQNISLQVRGEQHTYFSDVEQPDVVLEGELDTLRTLLKHTFDPSIISISLGVQFHI